MCGIAGCVAPPGSEPDRTALERMASALLHRGPDDCGIVIDGQVGFVHTRLAIIDPSSAGHQPMEGPAGRVLATYNGEIFNHRLLRDELPRARYASETDTETLLHAFESWGESAIPRCNGLFAYALFDRPGRCVLLVRDRFGVKPLYMARHNGCVWFASELGALLAAGVPPRTRPELLRHILSTGWSSRPETPLEAIDAVRPGTVVTIRLDSLATTERRWYRVEDVPDPELAQRFARMSRGELLTAVEDRLRESVRRRLMSDVPLGTMCSGGLDSSLITALAAREAGNRLHAFNAALVDRPEDDESPWARRVAQELGIELHTAPIDGATWRRTLVPAVRHNEYPLTHESTGPMAEIARVARSNGVKVLLSGEGADELFGGYPWRRTRAHTDYRLTALRRLARRRTGPGAAEGGPDPETNAYDAALDQAAEQAYAHHRGARRRLEGGLLADLSQYLPHLLNRQDKSTMQQSIETRVPFLDPDLVEIALNLPLEARVRPQRKQILRDIALHHLPAAVVERPKVGFGWDVRNYIVPFAQPEFLTHGRLAELYGLDPTTMRAVADSAQSHGTLLLWTGEIWCRVFLGGEADDQIAADLWAES